MVGDWADMMDSFGGYWRDCGKVFLKEKMLD